MDEKRKYELDGLLAFIRNKKLELLTECRPYRRAIEHILTDNHSNPLTREEHMKGYGPEPDPTLIEEYSDSFDIQNSNGTFKFLDITNYWAKLHRIFETFEEYLNIAMEAHWFLLYYSHRFHLTSWFPDNAISIGKTNSPTLSEIDYHLFSYYESFNVYGREMVQDVATFAAKSVGELSLVNLVTIYDDGLRDPSDRWNRFNSYLKTLPYTKSIDFTEVLDSIQFTFEHGLYQSGRTLFGLYLHGVAGYKYLSMEDEYFPKYMHTIRAELPKILPPHFSEASEFLYSIKEEYNVNRNLLDDEACRIVDELLGLSTLRPDRDKSTKTHLFPEVEEKYRYIVPKDVFDANKRIADDKYYVQRLVKDVREGDNPAEDFQIMFQFILKWGKIESKAEQDAMLTLLTGYYIQGAASRARWCGDDYMPRILYHIVKHISESRHKYAPLENVDFYASDQQAVGTDLNTIRKGNISAKVDEAIPPGVSRMLWKCYPSIFPKPKDEG